MCVLNSISVDFNIVKYLIVKEMAVVLNKECSVHFVHFLQYSLDYLDLRDMNDHMFNWTYRMGYERNKRMIIDGFRSAMISNEVTRVTVKKGMVDLFQCYRVERNAGPTRIRILQFERTNRSRNTVENSQSDYEVPQHSGECSIDLSNSQQSFEERS